MPVRLTVAYRQKKTLPYAYTLLTVTAQKAPRLVKPRPFRLFLLSALLQDLLCESNVCIMRVHGSNDLPNPRRKQLDRGQAHSVRHALSSLQSATLLYTVSQKRHHVVLL